MVIKQQSLFQQVNDYRNRHNPYPLYAEMLKTPIIREEDGHYVITSYRLVSQLLHDPRLSSDFRHLPEDNPKAQANKGATAIPFIRLDPPDHDRIRRMVTRQFGPPHNPTLVESMTNELQQLVNGLLDRVKDHKQIDIVEDYAYPFPVTVICKLLGVPREDEARFHHWADALVLSLDPVGDNKNQIANIQQGAVARNELNQYMAGLIEKHRQQPGDDMLSRLANDDGPDGQLTLEELVGTAGLLLIAGHETTVNLITNGMLTLLRHPDVLQRVRENPALIIPTVEELLRFEPPVQFNPQRIALADIKVEDQIIPKGSIVSLMLAAASRDPKQFTNPDQFIPDRSDNQHLGFGNGIHYCFGAPLARLEVQFALNTLVRRLVNPRLVDDPPPYRQSAVLRGPRHLLVEVDDILD